MKSKATLQKLNFALSLSGLLALCFGNTACTGQLPNSFRLAQQEQAFSSKQEVNTKIDLLWVIDNSASMDISQQKLRAGFAGFAQKYMQPTWDIRVAVITTDTYMAHGAFATYLNTTIPNTTGWISSYVSGRKATFVNPSWNPSLLNLSTGAFDSGIKFGELVPVWGPNFGRLLTGLHDGPIPALCSELMPYFMNGVTHCNIRDDQNTYSGPGHCLQPDTTAGEASTSQCVNTIQNDTIRSGKAIISTMPPEGTAGDAAWTAQLIKDFTINVTTGSAGQGSERGISSVLQLLSDNETTDTAFFRKGSLRGIIFVSDENDQSMTIPADPGADFKPQSYYKCDQAGLLALNSAAAITGQNGYCCSDPAKNCNYGSEGTSCAPKTVDGYTYTPSVCPREDMLLPIEDVKVQLDTFFGNIDGPDATGTSTANYFITSIVPLTAQAIQTLQTARNEDDTSVSAIRTVAVDQGDRYIALANQVGNGSISMNIADEDYSPILEAIGRAIIEKKSSFTLERAPTGAEDMIVKVAHQDGSSTIITSDKFVINNKTLMITDYEFVLSLAATDSIVINYQPKTVF